MVASVGEQARDRVAVAAGAALLLLGWRVWAVAGRPLPIVALAMDDFARMLDVRKVLAGVPLPTDVWPPVPAWLAAAVALVGVPLEYAAVVVNLLCTVATAVVLRDLARSSGASRGASAAAALAWCTGPWVLRLGNAGLAEPVADLALALGARALLADRGWAAAFGLVVAAGARYESLVWWLVLVAAQGRRRPFAAAAPIVPVAAWIAWEAHENDSVGAVLMLVRANAGETDVALDLAGALAAVGFAGLLGLAAAPRRAAVAWAAPTFLLACVALAGLRGAHTPARIFVASGMLLAPFAARALDRHALLRLGFGGLVLLQLPAWADADLVPSPDALAVVAWVRTHPGPVRVEVRDWGCLVFEALLPAGEVELERRPEQGFTRGSTPFVPAPGKRSVVTTESRRPDGTPLFQAGAWSVHAAR